MPRLRENLPNPGVTAGPSTRTWYHDQGVRIRDLSRPNSFSEQARQSAPARFFAAGALEGELCGQKTVPKINGKKIWGKK
jgi:hypothetical protein